ncbi:MAG TPA: hypothetical protein VMQ44_02565 [Candidatus Saccharimonadales bacterium]|nr:hypothetical protein [Candidatus Saccharimonadales bacterium]
MVNAMTNSAYGFVTNPLGLPLLLPCGQGLNVTNIDAKYIIYFWVPASSCPCTTVQVQGYKKQNTYCWGNLGADPHYLRKWPQSSCDYDTVNYSATGSSGGSHSGHWDNNGYTANQTWGPCENDGAHYPFTVTGTGFATYYSNPQGTWYSATFDFNPDNESVTAWTTTLLVPGGLGSGYLGTRMCNTLHAAGFTLN